jgi:hypothetical protein
MKTALMIVDVQKSLIDEGPFNAEEVLERLRVSSPWREKRAQP